MNQIPEELRDEVMKWRTLRRERPEEIEAAGPGQESVWDYPRPPRVEAVKAAIRVEFGGRVIARTQHAWRVLETSSPPAYYLPPEGVAVEYLTASDQTALCEWKGVSRYWHVVVGLRKSENAAWCYPEPWQGYAVIKDHFAFNASRVDACFVDGERVIPQPGEYYGGWITANVVGPFKGGPGTSRW
ncbi:MAG: DUF427 domain-containing protein [Candidatus Promineifilaceae bacterium]|nr:DUF427 domain-containing protein [Candidatus Promineifilaceae bacterium]